MKRLILFAVLLVAAARPASGQAGAGSVAGTWAFDQQIWQLTLEVNGSELSGSLTQGAQQLDIFDGRVDGRTLTFKARSADGDRVVTFAGEIDGDLIRFRRQVEVAEGGNPGGAGLLGLGGPDEVVARRATGDVWAGTIRNAPTQRNPDPNPNIRQVSLASRQEADPHWRWRGGDKERTVRTFNLPNQAFPLNAFALAGDRLTFSWSRPGPGDEVTCVLTRQPDTRFTGRCQSDVGGFAVLIALEPPAQGVARRP